PAFSAAVTSPTALANSRNCPIVTSVASSEKFWIRTRSPGFASAHPVVPASARTVMRQAVEVLRNIRCLLLRTRRKSLHSRRTEWPGHHTAVILTGIRRLIQRVGESWDFFHVFHHTLPHLLVGKLAIQRAHVVSEVIGIARGWDHDRDGWV